MELVIKLDNAELSRAVEAQVAKAIAGLSREAIEAEVGRLVQLQVDRRLGKDQLEQQMQRAIDAAVKGVVSNHAFEQTATAAIVSAARELVRGGPGK